MASLDSIALRLGLLQAVSPGSYQHAALSARWLAGMRRMMGKSAPETQEALEACVEAHTARYGRIGAETLAILVTGHEENDLVALLSECEEV